MLNIKNTTDGYLKDVEIKGNTIQDAENLADIRSVGDKVEGQELYEIPVLITGKNIFDGVWKENTAMSFSGSNVGQEYTANGQKTSYNYIRVKSNTTYRPSSSNEFDSRIVEYDCNKKPIKGYACVNNHFTTSENAKYIKFYVGSKSSTDVQIEEGIQATPYEPYKQHKLTILSPVQLEKVGDVADRIICKDGVWGVEKNVETFHYNGSETWNEWSSPVGEYIGFNTGVNDLIDGRGVVLCNKFNSIDGNSLCENIYYVNKVIYLSIKRARLASQNLVGLKAWLQANNMLVKYKLANPQFIPLPHSQQVKLRTFASKTNISFGCEIEGTIKAQVPKSLGATVNTHTEQINNLNKELDRVKKLEESTVSTVVTESNFTTVEETSNGYFEDVKLEGKTLANIVTTYNTSKFIFKDAIKQEDGYYKLQYGATVNNSYVIPRYGVHLYKPNTTYTIIVDIKENTTGTLLGISAINSCIDPKTISKRDFANLTGISTITFKTRDDITISDKGVPPTYDLYFGIWKDGGDLSKHITFRYWVLEGDHTQNPPSYFEGLKSVGQDVDEVSVESVNKNLFDGVLNYGVISTANGTPASPSNTSRFYGEQYIPVCNNMSIIVSKNGIKTDINIHKYDIDKNYIGSEYTSEGKIRVDFKGYIRIHGVLGVEENIHNTKIQIECNEVITDYIPRQSDKKPLLYYNNETQAWEKPILREWDSIEKHADGKYYYHQRSGEVVLNGSENWKDFEKSDTHVKTNLLVNDIKNQSILICDKFKHYEYDYAGVWEYEGVSSLNSYYGIIINCQASKLSTQDVQGFKQWLQANNVTVVYQLAEEKVYECTNIDLITYDGETNYIVNCGAIAPKSTLKVHSNISNVVRMLQQKVSLLENKFIQGLKQVLAGDMYSLATLLYPEDFISNESNIETLDEK